MLKFNRLVCLALGCGVVGVAWGALNRIPSFVVEDTYLDCDGVTIHDLNIDPAADGMAILNYAAGADKTIVQVIVSDFSGAPISGFIVRLRDMYNDVFDVGMFSVDSQGNGHFNGDVPGNHSGSNVELWQQVQPPPDCPAVLIAVGQ